MASQEKISLLRKEGHSYRTIAKKLKISYRAVYTELNKSVENRANYTCRQKKEEINTKSKNGKGNGVGVLREKRAQAVILYQEGNSYRKISKKLNISYGAAYRAVLRYKLTGSNLDKKRSGRPRKTTKKDDKFIVLSSARNRRLTAPEITANFNKTAEKTVSMSTISRRLNDAGLGGRVAAKKPLLRQVNKKKRLKWAREHRKWTIADWKKVLWTDESKFELFGTKRRVYVRRRVGERFKTECVVPTVKHGGGSIMVWGCFAGENVGDLKKIEGIMDKKVYHKILQYNAIPSGLRLIGEGFHFQQDNDPKHTSHFCNDYLQKKEEAGKLRRMIWPPQSPDLNPIELVWDELDRKLRESQDGRRNKTEMWECLKKNWENISDTFLAKLINRMPRICEAVIKSKGNFFEESTI